MSPNSASQPIDFLLQSFNALDPSVAQEPTRILDNLLQSRPAPLTDDQAIYSNKLFGFHYEYDEQQSAQSSFTKTALSVGLSGSYGVFSGSVKADFEGKTNTAAETFRSSYTANVSRGTLVFNQSDDTAAIAACLSDKVITALNAIQTMADAETFTRNHGTHVVLGVNLGGWLSVVVQISSTSFSEQDTFKAQVSAAYSGAGSVEAVASAYKATGTSSSSKITTQVTQVMGGNVSVDMSDVNSIKAWEDTCTTDTVSGLQKSIELWQLAADGEAGKVLKRYLDLCLLKHSLENPVVFSNHEPIVTEQFISVTATADAGYQIIGGGAWLDPRYTNYLNGCFPVLDSNNSINSWKAVSHDCIVTTASGTNLVAYALAVHDPANLLRIACTSTDGQSPPSAAQSATAVVADGFLLTGGGVETSTSQDVPQFATGSFPGPADGDDFSSWVARGHDYKYTSKATLRAWAVGLQAPGCPEIAITKLTVSNSGGLQSRGTTFAALGRGQKIAGGGVELEQPGGASPDTLQNLLQASFPTADPNQVFGWQESDCDLDGTYDKVIATAYAFTLQVTSTVAGVSFQAYRSSAQRKAPAAA